MSYLEYNVKYVPTGLRKVLYINWVLVLLISAVCGIGFLMLYSVSGGNFDRWAGPQMERFALGGLVLMFITAMVPIWFWRNMAGVAYLVGLVLLVLVEFVGGATGMGAQRWIDLGFMRLQPSELMKIAMVMMLAAYYDWLDVNKVSRPLWVALPVILILIPPTALVLRQPDLGTSVLLVAGGGGTIMLLAGVSLWYFAVVISGGGVGLVAAVILSKGTEWQLLNDYQYRRIDTFLDPASDPWGGRGGITSRNRRSRWDRAAGPARGGSCRAPSRG